MRVDIPASAPADTALISERPQPPASTARSRRLAAVVHRLKVWACLVVAIAIPIVAWQLVATRRWIDPVFTGKPSTIWTRFIDLIGTSTIATDLKTTLIETLIGFALAVSAGLLFGFLLARSPFLEEVFSPILTALNSIPRIALAPLFILWFGLGMTSKVALTISFVFFIIATNTVAALTIADRDRMLLARSLGASERQRMIYFVLPSAVPTLAAGLELGLIYSFMSSVIGEMIGGSRGLGVELTLYSNQFDTNSYFAVLLLIVLVTLAMVQLLRLVRRRLFRWSQIEMRGEHGFTNS